MKANKTYRSVVTIAGSDSSGGAGIQADIKTISALGCYAASIITALTAQNTEGVQAIYAVPPAFVTEQIESVFTDLNVDAVKIGMLHDQAMIEVIANALEKFKPPFVVIDPVMISKNGSVLLNFEAIQYLKSKLFPLASLITPNLFEVEKLMNKTVDTHDTMALAAMELGETFQINVLIKGGHLDSNQCSDVYYSKQNSSCYWFHENRIDTTQTHGTGCTLSAAIAAYLAQGCLMDQAILNAKKYLTEAIQSGSHYQLGSGCGPVDHFYFLEGMKS